MKTTLINLRTYRGPGDYVLIDRRTTLGNPYPISEWCPRERSVELYAGHFERMMKTNTCFVAAVESCRDKKLACWCVPELCHGTVIIRYLDEGPWWI